MVAGDLYDVLVVGAGPARSAAALAAAGGGLRVGPPEKTTFPRSKTCGGGLIGPTLPSLPALEGLPAREGIYRAPSPCGAGADGTSGRVGRHVGVGPQRVDLGLGLEVRANGTGSRWDG